MSMKEFKYLSGPSDWYEIEVVDDNGHKKTIELFGEQHNLEGICSEALKCKIDSKSPQSECYDITYLFQELFEESLQNKMYVDFFIEVPYNLVKEDIYKVPKKHYLGIIYDRFYDCFTLKKEKCKYLPYVRMHFTDLRSSFSFIDKSHELYSDIFTINDLIVDLFFEILSEINQNQSSPEKIMKSANFLNLLITKILPLSNKLFGILLTKDNYRQLYNNIFDQLIEYASDERQYNTSDVQNLKKVLTRIFRASKSVKDSDVNQFIIKRQLDELTKDNVRIKGMEISNLIKEYFITLYTQILQESISSPQLLTDKGPIQFDQNLLDLWNIIYENIYLWYTLNEKYSQLLQNKTTPESEIEKYEDQIQEVRMEVLQNGKLFYDLLKNMVLQLDALYLDVYILARMFRSFSNKKPSSLSIVYAGKAHILNQLQFFTDILKTTPNSYQTTRSSKNNRCLKNDKFSEIFNIERFK